MARRRLRRIGDLPLILRTGDKSIANKKFPEKIREREREKERLLYIHNIAKVKKKY